MTTSNNDRLVHTCEILKIRSVSHKLPNEAVQRSNFGIEFEMAVSLLLISQTFYSEQDTRPADMFEKDEETGTTYNSLFFEILLPGKGFTFSSMSDTESDCRNLRSATLCLKGHGDLYFNYATASVKPIFLDIACDSTYLKNRADGTTRRHADINKGGRLLHNFRGAEFIKVYGRTANLESVVHIPALVH